MRDIKRRRSSIQSTGQITRAMKLVATVKLQKAREKAEHTRPYSDGVYQTMQSILERSAGISHPYLQGGNNPRKAVIVMTSNRGLAGAKRARYHSSLIDANVTEPGEKLENLVETYVIFITEHDVLGKGKPIYHIDRVIKETGENFGDEAHILYVNGEYRDESPIGTLMHDFSCTNAKDIKYRTLAERVRYFKEDEKGVAAMCKAMEDMRDEAALAARLAERKEVASRLLKKGAMSFEEIAEISQLSVEEVRALAGKRGA